MFLVLLMLFPFSAKAQGCQEGDWDPLMCMECRGGQWVEPCNPVPSDLACYCNCYPEDKELCGGDNPTATPPPANTPTPSDPTPTSGGNTPTPSDPTATPPPANTPTPPSGTICDPTCGTCGVRRNGSCGIEFGNNDCCHMACVGGSCQYINGVGAWDCYSCGFPTPTPTRPPTSIPTNTPTPDACSCPVGKPAKALGNANCDTLVNTADYAIWLSEYQGTVTTKTADFNCDTKIDGIDFEFWRRGRE